jgi:hypothetical protein
LIDIKDHMKGIFNSILVSTLQEYDQNLLQYCNNRVSNNNNIIDLYAFTFIKVCNRARKRI